MKKSLLLDGMNFILIRFHLTKENDVITDKIKIHFIINDLN